jgi:hypothetical protein
MTYLKLNTFAISETEELKLTYLVSHVFNSHQLWYVAKASGDAEICCTDAKVQLCKVISSVVLMH